MRSAECKVQSAGWGELVGAQDFEPLTHVTGRSRVAKVTSNRAGVDAAAPAPACTKGKKRIIMLAGDV